MTRLQVVLAATGLEPIRDVLQDWSAVGLVAPFVWQASGEASGALLVADGRGRRMPVQAVAADSQSDQAVFTVLGAALDGVAEVPSDEVARVEELVVGSLAAGVAVSRVRATVVLAGSGGTTSRLASPGWYNLVLAPEESDRPGAAGSSSTPPRRRARWPCTRRAASPGRSGSGSASRARPSATNPPRRPARPI